MPLFQYILNIFFWIYMNFGQNAQKYLRLHLNNINYYSDYVKKYKIFYGSKNEVLNIKIRKSLNHFIFPTFISFFYGLTSLYSLRIYEFEERILCGKILYPDSVADEIEFCLFVWALLYVLYGLRMLF